MMDQQISDLPQRFCANCGHHYSYHRLVTRDKWEEYGVRNGAIPWICQYEECECTTFQPRRET